MELVTLHLEQARQGEHHSFSHLQSKEQEVGDTQSSPPSPPQLAYLRTLSGVLAHHLLPPSYTQTPVPPPPLAPALSPRPCSACARTWWPPSSSPAYTGHYSARARALPSLP